MRKAYVLIVIALMSFLFNCGKRKNPLEPEFVTLLSPVNSEIVTSTAPLFEWNGVSYSYLYQIQIDDKNTFYSPIIDDSTLTSTTFQCPYSLSDREYWWRVRVRQEYSGWEVWSETGRFTVSVGTPVPMYPVDDTIDTGTPTFSWNPILNAVKYRIQIDDFNTFYTPLFDDSSLTVEQYVPDSTIMDGFYYWRVRVKTGDGEWSHWSPSASFGVDANPFKVIANIQTMGYARDVLVRDDTAYVAQGEGGFMIVDLTDEENPLVVGQLDNTHGTAYGLAVMDSFAYIAVGKNGVSSVDFSDPQNPQWLQLIGGGEDNAVDLVVFYPEMDTMSYVFVAEKDEGMWVLQVYPAFPGYPQPFYLYNVPGYENGLFLDSTLLYVACGELGLQIVDMSDISNPSIIGACDTKGYANEVFVRDTLVYIADGREGLTILNAADPTSPYIIGVYDTSDDALGLCVKGDTAFVADENAGYVVLDVSDPTLPQFLGGTVTEYAETVWVEDDYAIVVDRYDGLLIVKWD
jgi:hypothetical protein